MTTLIRQPVSIQHDMAVESACAAALQGQWCENAIEQPAWLASLAVWHMPVPHHCKF